MEKQYTSMSREVQKLLQERGGTFHYHSEAEISPGMQQEHLGWTVTFPEGTTTGDCLLWTPDRRGYLLYSLPGGGNTVLVEPKEETDLHRNLYLLTPEMQEKYGLSLPLDTQGCPEISEREGLKEILVPGQRRNGGRAIFLDGFGTGRPGFELVYVLFTYHPGGKREIYLLPPDEKDDASKRYAHLHEHMPAQAEPGKPRIVMVDLDHHLKEAYGIDWEQELKEIAYER
jgi:hypothetical protein